MMTGVVYQAIRFSLIVALGILILGGTRGVSAGPIDFDKNEIKFTKPADDARRTFQFNAPTLAMRDDGYMVSDLTYTVTSKVASGKIDDALWTSNRMFQVTAATGVVVHIEGETDIMLTGGTDVSGLGVSGEIFQDITFKGSVLLEPQDDIKFDPKNPDKKYPKTWKMDSDVIKLAPGMYRLEMDSGPFSFKPEAVGDKLTISSTYLVTVSIPEPSTWALLVLGLGFIILVRVLRRPKEGTVCMAAIVATIMLVSGSSQAGQLTWTGLTNANDDGNWTTKAANKNWVNNNAQATSYADGDDVTFDDSAGGITTVTIQNGGVQPGFVTFNNEKKDYALTGGAITKATVFQKLGTGLLTVQDGNTYDARTTIANGTVEIGGDNPFGTGTLQLGTPTASPTMRASKAVTIGNKDVELYKLRWTPIVRQPEPCLKV
jgi:autotransporter-associated beta strand protein